MIKVSIIIITNFNEIGYNGYKLWRPIEHSNGEVTTLILSLAAENNYRNARLIGLKY